jgi:hypothetical protein
MPDDPEILTAPGTAASPSAPEDLAAPGTAASPSDPEDLAAPAAAASPDPPESLGSVSASATDDNVAVTITVTIANPAVGQASDAADELRLTEDMGAATTFAVPDVVTYHFRDWVGINTLNLPDAARVVRITNCPPALSEVFLRGTAMNEAAVLDFIGDLPDRSATTAGEIDFSESVSFSGGVTTAIQDALDAKNWDLP